MARSHPDKPFIISETGAGGILGDHNRSATNSSEPARWSLEYQVVVDRDDALVAMVSAGKYLSAVVGVPTLELRVDPGPGGPSFWGCAHRLWVCSGWVLVKCITGTRSSMPHPLDASMTHH